MLNSIIRKTSLTWRQYIDKMKTIRHPKKIIHVCHVRKITIGIYRWRHYVVFTLCWLSAF